MSSFIIIAIFSLVVAARGQDVEESLECPGGFCVSKYLCQNSTFIADPKAAQTKDIIGLRISEVDDCLDYLLVCCAIDQPVTEKPNPEDLLPYDVCGKANEKGLFYELHANESLAQYGEFPWVVYIFTSNETAKPFVAGGSLISPRFVLTVAHNVDGKTNLIARFGEWDISTDKEPFPHQDIPVEDIVTHPDYVKIPIKNDIALLSLSEAVVYQKHIRPICLPQPEDQFDEKRCISNGWGSLRGVYENIMKKITLPVIPRNRCNRMLRFGGLGPFYLLEEGFMCAGGEDKVDTCKGDGGSPLACLNEDDSYVLAGIVSWGIGCGGANLPGVYVSVNKYIGWINEQIYKMDKLRDIII